ncbi:MAG TPA: hypothetical protein EYP43_01100, partial [Thermoplasmata archaeon]|nr:hypothetical protein [Thermoplasmata archaeon]
MSLHLRLTNDGNVDFDGNITFAGDDVEVLVTPSSVPLAPGDTVDVTVRLRSYFIGPGGDYLPAGSRVNATLHAGTFSVSLSLTALPMHVVTLSSNGTVAWANRRERVTFELEVSNDGNVWETLNLSLGGRNVSWASLSAETIVVAPGASARTPLSFETTTAGTAEVVVVASNLDVASNTVTITVYFHDELETVLLYGPAVPLAEGVGEAATAGDAVAWSNATGVHLMAGSTLYHLGSGEHPAVGTHDGEVAVAWYAEGKVMFTSSADGMVPEEVSTISRPDTLSVVPGPVATVAVSTSSSTTVFMRTGSGSWNNHTFGPGDSALVPWGSKVYLLLPNDSAHDLLRLPAGEVVSTLPLDTLLDVSTTGGNITFLGLNGSEPVLVRGTIDAWSNSTAPGWSEALLDTDAGPAIVGLGEGVLLLRLDGLTSSMPLRPTWPLIEVPGGHLPPVPTGGLYAGRSLVYIAGETLYELGLSPVIRVPADGTTVPLLLYGPAANLSMTMSDAPFGWSANVPASTGLVELNITPDGALEGVLYPVEIALTDGIGFSNGLVLNLVPEEYVLLNVSADDAVVPGRTTGVDLLVENRGSIAAHLAVEVDLPGGWTATHPASIDVGPGSGIVLSVNVTAPLTEIPVNMTLHLNGTEDHVFVVPLSLETALPEVVIYTVDSALSGTIVNFTTERTFIDNWTWFFDDGAMAWGPEVSHVYAHPGTY